MRTPAGFWHGTVPMHALGLYRAGLGAICLVESLRWLPHTTELFSNQGFHLGPAASLAPPPSVALGACLLLAMSSLAVAVGWRTRSSILVTLILWSWLYAIDWIDEKTNSSLTIIALFLLLFSGCGKAVSVDAFRARRRGDALDAVGWVFWQRLLQLEFAQVYFFAGVIKLLSQSWQDGTTLARALGSRWATDFGVWMTSWLPGWLVQTASIGAVVYELTAGFLLFVPRLRPWIIAAGLVFHTLIQLTLNVGVLGPHFVLALLVLYPRPETVELFLKRCSLSGWHQTTNP